MWLLPHHMTAPLRDMVLSADEIAADSTDSPVYLLSRQTAISSAKLQLFVFGLLLTPLFSRIVVYITWHTVRSEKNTNRIFGTAVQRRHNSVNVLNVGLCRRQMGCTWMSFNVNCDTHGGVHGRG